MFLLIVAVSFVTVVSVIFSLIFMRMGVRLGLWILGNGKGMDSGSSGG